MTFAKSFKISSYCLIGSGFAAIASTGAIDTISILLFSCIFIISWFVNTHTIRQTMSPWRSYGLAVSYAFFMAVDYKLLSLEWTPVFLHLLFFISATKLLTHTKDRDYLQLYLVSILELVVAGTLTLNITFIFCFLIFLFAGVSSLCLFEMRRSHAAIQRQANVRPYITIKSPQEAGLELFAHFPSRIFSLAVLGMTLLIMAGAIPLFLLIPRVHPVFNRQPSGPTRLISGFADRVELGRGGAIQQSDAIVMRIRTDIPPAALPPNIKWRGLAFDYFDGRSWTRRDQNRHAIPVQGRFYKLEDSAQGTNWIQQTFFIESLSTNVVFAAHRALAISRDAGTLQRDSLENLYADRKLHSKLRYSVISDRVDPAPLNILDFAPIPPEILDTYLQLPEMDPRIAQLANAATHGISSRYAKALALGKYLRSHYAYSLKLERTPGNQTPLARFLFDVRSGHCEYFASALTIMLREIGIPARLINGFRTGEYNSIGNNWTVRQYHAHSWVEAYFPPYGWIEFDPTPTDPPSPRTAFSQRMSDLWDAMGLWWWDGIVSYDSPKQYLVLNTLFSFTDRLLNGIEHMIESVKDLCRSVPALLHSPIGALGFGRKWAPWILGVLIAVALLIVFVRIRVIRIVRRILYRNNARTIASSFYAEALQLLRLRGIESPRELTPMEFAQSLGNHPASSSLLALTHMYYAARFGYPDIPFPQEQAQSLIHSLKNALQQAG